MNYIGCGEILVTSRIMISLFINSSEHNNVPTSNWLDGDVQTSANPHIPTCFRIRAFIVADIVVLFGPLLNYLFKI